MYSSCNNIQLYILSFESLIVKAWIPKFRLDNCNIYIYISISLVATSIVTTIIIFLIDNLRPLKVQSKLFKEKSSGENGESLLLQHRPDLSLNKPESFLAHRKTRSYWLTTWPVHRSLCCYYWKQHWAFIY